MFYLFVSDAKMSEIVKEHVNSFFNQEYLDSIDNRFDSLEHTSNQLYTNICNNYNAIEHYTHNTDLKIEEIEKRIGENALAIEQIQEKNVFADTNQDYGVKVQREVNKYLDGFRNELLEIISEKIAGKGSELYTKTEINNIISETIAVRMRGIEEMQTDNINQIIKEQFDRLCVSSEQRYKMLKEDLNQKNQIIDDLNHIISNDRELVAQLSKRLDKQDTMIANLNKIVEKLQSSVKQETPVVLVPKREVEIVFSDDSENNIASLYLFIDETKKLKKLVQEQFSGQDNVEVYIKLIDKTLEKLKSILEKNQLKEQTPDKLAHDIAKLLKQTIIRGMTQKDLKEIFENYLYLCGVRKLDWRIGKHIEDDDYDYLEEPILTEEVNNPNLVDTILKIEQDTYVIDFEEDGEKREAVIPGIYCLGKMKQQ